MEKLDTITISNLIKTAAEISAKVISFQISEFEFDMAFRKNNFSLRIG